MSKLPEQCSTCEHYDNMIGACLKFNSMHDYVCHCKHYELAKDLMQNYDDEETKISLEENRTELKKKALEEIKWKR